MEEKSLWDENEDKVQQKRKQFAVLKESNNPVRIYFLLAYVCLVVCLLVCHTQKSNKKKIK